MKSEVLVFRIDDTTIKNDKTGEVKPYVILNYLLKLDGKRYSMNCYVDAKFKDICEKYVDKTVMAELSQTVQSSSTVKYRIVSLNNEKVR